MEVVKLKPATHDNLWGGTKLKTEWGKECDTPILAECWELSFHKNGPCLVDSGENKGKLLKDVASETDCGTLCKQFPFFPVLIKFINSAQDLSVQVHPSDDYALKNEGEFGKTEIWYVLDAEPGAGLYVGLNKDYSAEDLRAKLDNGTIMDALNFYTCKPGDLFIITSGTIHAIGKGMTVVEVQQNSDLTYRLYDYNRPGKDGKLRELHIDKAMKVVDLHKYQKPEPLDGALCKFKYFSCYECDSKNMNFIDADENSFVSLTVIDGSGKVNELDCKKGDSFFVPASKKAILKGDFNFILTKLEK